MPFWQVAGECQIKYGLHAQRLRILRILTPKAIFHSSSCFLDVDAAAPQKRQDPCQDPTKLQAWQASLAASPLSCPPPLRRRAAAQPAAPTCWRIEPLAGMDATSRAALAGGLAGLAAFGAAASMSSACAGGEPEPEPAAPAVEQLLTEAIDWCACNGLLVRGAAGGFDHCPVSLLPTPLPRAAFESARSIGGLFAKLVDKVARDPEWLGLNLKGAAEGDEFTKCLYDIYQGLPKTGQQQVHLGIHRSDYMLHEETEAEKSLPLFQAQVRTCLRRHSSSSVPSPNPPVAGRGSWGRAEAVHAGRAQHHRIVVRLHGPLRHRAPPLHARTAQGCGGQGGRHWLALTFCASYRSIKDGVGG